MNLNDTLRLFLYFIDSCVSRVQFSPAVHQKRREYNKRRRKMMNSDHQDDDDYSSIRVLIKPTPKAVNARPPSSLS